ncbi:MAG: OadG family protein [Clostridia bacterium]|nr:OadG family protein [Clostridia bacterium]
MADIPNWFAVCMGLGTVFVGLICIIIICKIMSIFFYKKEKPEKVSETADVKPKAVTDTAIENKEQIIAAVTAVCAEVMGKDISALRVVSFKKVNN